MKNSGKKNLLKPYYWEPSEIFFHLNKSWFTVQEIQIITANLAGDKL